MNPSKEWKHISTKTARLTASVGRSKPGEAELKTSHAAAAGATSSVASARRSQAAEELHLTKAPTAFDITEDTIREARALDHGPNPADSLCMTTSKVRGGFRHLNCVAPCLLLPWSHLSFTCKASPYSMQRPFQRM